MGQKKTKRVYFENLVPQRIKWIEDYLAALKNIMLPFSENFKSQLPCLIGRTIIYPCRDGLFIIVYENFEGSKNLNFTVDMQPASWKTMDQISNEERPYHKSIRYKGQIYRFEPSSFIIFGDLSESKYLSSYFMAGLGAYTPVGFIEFEFKHFIFLGWKAVAPSPLQKAIEDWQTAVVFLNNKKQEQKKSDLVVNVGENENNHTEAFEMTVNKLEKLLNEGTREESIQVFLKENPFLIYPKTIHCIPKFSLAGEYVTDFLFAISSQHGPRLVMV